MKRVIGFNQGQYGDICMAYVAAKSLKQTQKDLKFTLGINKDFADIAPLFLYNDVIDDVHIWEAYDNWPSYNDKQTIKNYDVVYNPMQPHTESNWYLHRHQIEELCKMHSISIPLNLRINLKDYFSHGVKNRIAVSLLGKTRGNEKSLNLENAKRLCEALSKKFNLDVYQIGAPNEPSYCNKFIGTFFDATKFLLESKFFITVDTCWSWIASGYNKPTIGLYSYNYYKGSTSSKNWQPINDNALYIDSDNVNNIQIETIFDAITQQL